MTKVMLHLSIEPEIIELAKSSGLNLSKEFEEWLRIRLNQFHNEKPTVDIDLEVAKHHAEIVKLQSQKELSLKHESQDKEELMVIDEAIDNEIKFAKDKNNMDWDKLIEERTHGIQFLFRKKFNKELNPLQAKEILEKRIKERGLMKDG
jgi:hypothetical protein